MKHHKEVLILHLAPFEELVRQNHDFFEKLSRLKAY